MLSRDDAVRRGLRRRPARLARAVPAADRRGDGGDGRRRSTPVGRSARCRCCGSTAAEDALVPIDGSRIGIERLRGETFAEHEYPGARHEVFNETNSDEVLADVIAFIDACYVGTEAAAT